MIRFIFKHCQSNIIGGKSIQTTLTSKIENYSYLNQIFAGNCNSNSCHHCDRTWSQSDMDNAAVDGNFLLDLAVNILQSAILLEDQLSRRTVGENDVHSNTVFLNIIVANWHTNRHFTKNHKQCSVAILSLKYFRFCNLILINYLWIIFKSYWWIMNLKLKCTTCVDRDSNSFLQLATLARK